MPQNKKSEKHERIEEQAEICVKDIIESSGYKIWDVIFEKEGAMWYLKILFDTPEGIENPGKSECGLSSEECEKITAPLNAVIDKQPFADKIDILEIGSPGLTRKLRKAEHFNLCKGLPVCASVRGDNGKTVYKRGALEGYDAEKGCVLIENEELFVKKCIKINLDL